VNRTVVVGVDGSELAVDAARWAAAHARRHGFDLRLVRAYQLPGSTPESDRRAMRSHVRRQLWDAARAAHAVAPEVPAEQRDVEGDPLAVLSRESESARTLVVGARGVGGFAALLVGSVSDSLARRAACPLVVVREVARSDDELRRVDRVRPVVVGIDGSPASEAALRFAFAEADAWSAPLVAVHTWNDYLESPGVPDWSEWHALETEEKEVLAERLAGWGAKYPDVKVSREVLHSSPAKAIVARSASTRLVVVGWSERVGLDRMLVPSTTRAVLHHAECPVAVIRSPEVSPVPGSR
jgi:nucleotide-binding universal stress UspA family protein